MAIPWLKDSTLTAASANGDVSGAADSTSVALLPISPGEGPSGSAYQGPQAVWLHAEIDNSGGTASLQFVITEVDGATTTVVYREAITLTVTALRTGAAGNTGNYLMSVSCPKTGTDTLDVGRMVPGCKAYLVLTAIGGSATQLRVRVSSTRNAG